jgi:hypothetical protein
MTTVNTIGDGVEPQIETVNMIGYCICPHMTNKEIGGNDMQIFM